MQSNILLSIIIPAFNVERFIESTLKMLIAQNLEKCEVIVIDDGSKDNTLQIAEKIASEDKRIKVIHQENSGQGQARNKGMDIANGKYIGFVDSDDWIDLNMYEELYNSAITQKVDIVVCGRKLYDKN